MRCRLPLILTLALGGCGGADDTTIIRKQDGRTVTIISNGDRSVSTVIDSDARPAASTDAKWPADAPAYAAAFPGARVTTVVETMANGTKGRIVTFDTVAAPADLVQFYQARSEKSGLARIAALANAQSSLFSAGDPRDGRAITIQAAAKDDHTAAALTYALPRANR